MKYSLLKSSFFIFCTLFFSTSVMGQNTSDFKILPSPQEFEISGVSKWNPSAIKNYHAPITIPLLHHGIKPVENSLEAQIIATIDSNLKTKDEGYQLSITNKNINIIGKDAAGLLYGFVTLHQLLEDAKEQKVNLPLCNILDYPKLSYRAVHLDVKHHLEKKNYYYKLMDWLAQYKINAVILEMEDKIQYKSQPEIASSDAFSVEEWAKLAHYAKERNIEISPLVQGLGHVSFILKHEKYKALRDNPESDWAFNPLDPKTYEVQFDLYREAIAATPHGKYLHIGGDEVHTTGRNSGKSSLELQLIWLNKVCKFAEKHGRIPIFWDDMPLKHAGLYDAMFNTKLTEVEVRKIWEKNEHKLTEFLDQFPKNCIYMRWNYSSPQAIGNLKAMDWFKNNGLQVMGATAGQTRWVLMPQNQSNIESIKSFAASSIKNNLNGLLLTLWDDDSPHFELYKRGILAFAEYAWSGEQRSTAEFKSAYRQREFSSSLSDSEFAFIDDLEKPVAFWKNALLKGNKRNYLHKMKQPMKEGVIDFPVNNNKGKWSAINAKRIQEAKQMIEICKDVELKIEEIKTKAIKNTYTLEIYEQVNNLSKFSANLILLLQQYDIANNSTEEKEALDVLMQQTDEFENLRKQLELVYGKTRVLNKPDDYILDQDHHVHLANQSISFDWQFYAEILFFKKIKNMQKPVKH